MRIPSLVLNMHRHRHAVAKQPSPTRGKRLTQDQKQDTSFKRIGKDALIYGLQPALSRLVGFLMLPIYTRYLTPADYGVLQLLDTTADVASIIFVAGAIAGTTRFYFKAIEERARLEVLSTAFILLSIHAAIGATVLILGAGLAHDVILRGFGTPGQVQIAALNFWTATLSSVPMLYLQVRQKAATFTVLGVGRLILQLSLNILFVVGLEWGVTGVLVSTLITNVAIGSVLAVTLLRVTGFRFSRAVWADMRRFGRPIKWTNAGSYVLNFGDRYFIQAFAGPAAVGLYGIAYQFGFVYSQFFTAPFLRAWSPVRFMLGNEPPDTRNPVYDRAFFLFSVLLLVGYTAFALGIRPVLMIMTTPEFHSAASFVPVIVAAYVAQAWTETWRFQIDMSEQTKYYAYATLLSVAVILVLYTVLIPPYGAAGAAWATFLGFAFRTVITRRFAERLWPIPFSWGRIRGLGVFSVLVSLVPALVPELRVVPLTAGLMALGLVYLAVVWLAFLTPEDRASARAQIGQLVARIRPA